jgi:hypothetical protein
VAVVQLLQEPLQQVVLAVAVQEDQMLLVPQEE